ncbi:unnamed protein product [Rotaria sp. Silwood1]|nr:unnamed protein product [Rotaria sp. Silwood1]CAF1225558.1 unnamed protein product [Rotaria sp. Silwood1]CAF3442433.1 unnamed protein product [Rotaria sp. Silwood1]CAF3495772.1 unnamed protein product [Rotaria sp. Silwood1]CAF3513949.1 unnamed protein product [Rotaria sp. Silwood1]
MSNVHQLLILLFVAITLTKSYNISSCIPNTPCKCYFTQYSFKLFNCSHTLYDLPIFNSKTTNNITKIIAPNSFNRWPIQLCKYSNIQILDLSGSYFDSQYIDLSCLSYLIHLNLSNTQLNKIPNFKKNFSNHLQILDLSNNHIKFIDGIQFQSLNNLISLFLQNNPIKYIEHLEDLFYLSNLQSINLISSNLDSTLKQSLTINQWIIISQQWNNSRKLFSIRMKNIPLQFIIPNPEQFPIVSIDLMKIILKTLINSTFITLFNTPKCDCSHLRPYQRMFSFVDYQKKYSSPLFQSTTCLMPDGITHARLFDRRTYIDLRCPLLGKISFFPLIESSSSSLSNLLIPFSIFYLFLMH